MGLLLILMGIMMPILINVKNLGIYPNLYHALNTGEIQYTILAAFKLVMLNGIRGFPHYLGAFIIGESVTLYHNEKEIKFMKTWMVCSIIPLVYWIIEKIYHIKYDFGIPAVLVITLLVIMEKIDFNMVNVGKKTLLVGMILMTFQWLDVAPYLSSHAFGRGETSNDIKNAAIILESGIFLQYISLFLFFLFILTDSLLFKLILDENNLRLMAEENRKNQQILMESNMRVMENRTYMELRNLVHDLKSPLTSIQALVGVIKLGEKNDTKNLHLGKIETSIERMSSMISEILYEEHKSIIPIKDMIKLVLSQISGSEYGKFVKSNDCKSNLLISVNKIRFSRAIINLIENSYHALNLDHGYINLTVKEVLENNTIYGCIQVEDNGTGIASQDMINIWKSGYSTRDSLGLGLGFVQKVIEDNDGIVHMDSIEGKGTNVTIFIPAKYPHVSDDV